MVLKSPKPLATANQLTLNSLQLIHLYFFNYISGAREQVDSNLSAFAWKTKSPPWPKYQAKDEGWVGCKTKQKLGHIFFHLHAAKGLQWRGITMVILESERQVTGLLVNCSLKGTPNCCKWRKKWFWWLCKHKISHKTQHSLNNKILKILTNSSIKISWTSLRKTTSLTIFFIYFVFWSF